MQPHQLGNSTFKNVSDASLCFPWSIQLFSEWLSNKGVKVYATMSKGSMGNGLELLD